jgi:protein-S-isoprenylcysteine O-methyltransferase Ste14
MYSAIFLFGMAQGLLLDNHLAGWSALVSFLPMYLRRVPREERMMLDHFGDEYRAYLARTHRLFPRL